MGTPKALLPFAGSTFLGHLIGMFEASMARPILVVLGHGADDIQREVQLGEARALVHTGYQQGMLSSIRAGLQALADEPVEAILVCPVDHPRLKAKSIDRIIGGFHPTRPPVVIPVYNGRRGHPVLFSRSVFGELINASDAVGARQVVWGHAGEVMEVELDDEGILVDVDTPEDYRNLLGGE